MQYKVKATSAAMLQKVVAIKMLRELTGFGLKEAKDFIERTYESEYPDWINVHSQLPYDFTVYFSIMDRTAVPATVAATFDFTTEVQKLIILAVNAKDFENAHKLIQLVR